MQKKLWGGRFKKKTDPLFESFSSSLKWDRRLLPYDLAIDAAHVTALKKCGVLTAAESKKLLSALRDLQKKAESGSLRLDPKAEDVHSAVQGALAKKIGGLADKLHTARSRNDLVSQSSRLYCKEHAKKIYALLVALQRTVVGKAEETKDVLLPGMTHLQNAQVVSQGHIFLAYAEMLERSKARFILTRDASDVCVLGSGALAGVTFALDQKLIARQLGLARVTTNSYDVSGDRDFILNFLSACTVLGTHLSRIAEDLLIGQGRGSALIEMDEAYCTGSSMMPQKKNADFAELARSSIGVFAGNLTGFLLTLKGLPTSYNRDLQWDKGYLFDSVETCEELLQIFTGLVRSLKVNRRKAKELLADETLYATDLADWLVKKGIPFMAAHEQVGKIVSFSESCGKPISKISLDLLKTFAPKLDGSVYELFSAEHSVRLKKTLGSTHPDRVKAEISAWKRKLKK